MMSIFPQWRMSLLAAALVLSPAALAQDEMAGETQEAAPPAEAIEPAEPQQPAYNAKDVSYAVGYKIAQSWLERLAGDGLEYSAEELMAGFKAGLAGEKSRLSDEQIEQAMMSLQNELMRLSQEKQSKAADENLAKGKAFLEKNGQREGVVTTESGLQYEVIKPGEGEMPKMGDEVTVHYTGTLVDGTVFDSSVNPPQPGRPAEPATFQLGQVIQGWNEGLTHVAPGGHIRLYIPSDLAYGPMQRGPVIGPNCTLIFDVELISVQPAEKEEKAAE